MKKTFLALLMGLLLAAAPLAASSSVTNLPGGIGIGSVSGGTYSVLTPVSTVKMNIPLQSMVDNVSYLPITLATAVTTAIYMGQATGLTNHAAIIFPSQPASLVGVLQFRVPGNYYSGGTLYAIVHASSTVTTYGVSVTADVYYNDLDSTTVTTKAAGTVVQFPTTANVRLNTLALTNSSITFKPNQLVTYKITVAGTDAVTRQFLGFYFQYRPWGVYALWPGEGGKALGFLGEQRVPVLLRG